MAEYSPLSCLTVYMLFCVTGSYVVAVFDKNECTYTFSVWHPDQNILQQIKELQMQYANFTNYAELQVSRIQRNVIHEMRQYDNRTSFLEGDLSQIRMDSIQAKLQHSHLVSQVNMIRRDLEDTSSKVDDLEMDYFSLKTRTREPRNDSIRKGHRSLSKDFIGMMKNSVGDLKAEWLLMKRELDDIRTENVQLRHGQNDLKNDTTSIRNVVKSLSSNIQSVDGPTWQVPQYNPNLHSAMTGLKMDLGRLQEEQNDFVKDTSDIRNELATLQSSNIRIQKDVHELQLESSRMKEKLQTAQREERNGRESEIIRERIEADVTLSDSHMPRDCHEVYQSGYRSSGVYNVHPVGSDIMISVYCEMVNKTGYTLLQRRIDGLLNFNKRWLEYKHGFGNPYGEYYIGNYLLNILTKQKHYILRVDMWDWEGHKAYAEYSAFTIEDEAGQYRIHVSGYNGDAGDSLSYHDNMAFSTEDVDNDLSTRHCAEDNKGGWWFNSCYSANLNGIYHTAWYSQSRSTFADGVAWYTWKDTEFYSLKKVEMKLRPKVP